MKILLIFIGIILLVFVGVQVFAMKSQKNIETYAYDLIKAYGSFEIRQYEASLFTSVQLSGNKYKEESGKGFSVLAGYIFGGNEKEEKISMTSPVSLSLEDSMTMMFLVPKSYNKETLPKPNESKIEFKEVPAKKMAAITFSGWADDKKIELYKQKLKEALDAEGISYTNKFYFFGYNAPYETMNRKNEILVEL